MSIAMTIALIISWFGSTLLGMLVAAEMIRMKFDGMTFSIGLHAVTETEDDHK